MTLVRSLLKIAISFGLLLGGLGLVLTFAYLITQTGREPESAVARSVATFVPRLSGRGTPVTILEDNAQHVFYTRAGTVAGALRAAGITLGPEDRVEPPADTPLTPEMRIVVIRPVPVTIQAGDQVWQGQLAQGTVADALDAAGIVLGAEDTTRPEADTPLQPHMVIQVVRVTRSFIEEDEPLPYDTVWEPTETLELDTEGLLVPGVPGVLRRRFQVTYENSVEVDRTFTEEWVVQEPVSEVMGYGTNIVIRVLDTEVGQVPYWRKVTMRVTSYTASSAGRPPDHPLYGVTASGYQAQTGIVAIDPKITPFRSWVYVPGYGLGYAGDTGGEVLGRWIDLGYDEDAFIPWSGYVDVYYLTPVPDPERINYRLPRELP